MDRPNLDRNDRLIARAAIALLSAAILAASVDAFQMAELTFLTSEARADLRDNSSNISLLWNCIIGSISGTAVTCHFR